MCDISSKQLLTAIGSAKGSNERRSRYKRYFGTPGGLGNMDASALSKGNPTSAFKQLLAQV
jgi:hypothetical protein